MWQYVLGNTLALDDLQTQMESKKQTQTSWRAYFIWIFFVLICGKVWEILFGGEHFILHYGMLHLGRKTIVCYGIPLTTILVVVTNEHMKANMWLPKPTTSPITPIYTSSNSPIGTMWPFPHIHNTTQECKYELLLDTLKEAIWWVTLTIFTRRHSHKYHHKKNEQCHIPLMPTHARIQQIHLIAIKYLTLLMFNKRRLKTHQLPILPSSMQRCKNPSIETQVCSSTKIWQ